MQDASIRTARFSWSRRLTSPLAPAALLGRLTRGAEAATVGDITTVPTLGRDTANDDVSDQATLVAHAPERLVVQTTTATDGILVLSEVAYPGWQATIDGAPTPIYVADGLLRAVALPAGDHLVELRFESDALRIGVTVSILTATALTVCCMWSLVRSRRIHGAI